MNINLGGLAGIKFISLEGDVTVQRDEIVFKDNHGKIVSTSIIEELRPWTFFDLYQSVQMQTPLHTQITAYAHPMRLVEHKTHIDEEVNALVVGLYLQQTGRLKGKLHRHHWLLEHWNSAKDKLDQLIKSNAIDDFIHRHEKLWKYKTFTGYAMPDIGETETHISIMLTDPNHIHQFATRNFALVEALNKCLDVLGIPEQDWPYGDANYYNRLMRLENIPLSLLDKLGFRQIVLN